MYCWRGLMHYFYGYTGKIPCTLRQQQRQHTKEGKKKKKGQVKTVVGTMDFHVHIMSQVSKQLFFSPYCSEVAFCWVGSSAAFLRRWLAQYRTGTQTSDIAIFAVSCLCFISKSPSGMYLCSVSLRYGPVMFQLHLLEQTDQELQR